MQTTFRLKAKEVSMSFLNSLKALFEGEEVEITVKSVKQKKGGLLKEEVQAQDTNGLLKMIRDNRQNAPVIPQGFDIRGLIDDAHNPEHP